MWHAPQGVHDLLRAMYYFKSADWKGNEPFPLKSWRASELAKMPAYYIMDLDKGIAETMAAQMPSKAQISACQWMTEKDLQVCLSIPGCVRGNAAPCMHAVTWRSPDQGCRTLSCRGTAKRS